MKTLKKMKKLKPSFKSKKDQLLNEMKEHPAWHGELSLIEAAQELNGKAPWTYLLSQGMDTCHFFLSYVDTDNSVKHKNIRILSENGILVFKNGVSHSFESIYPLIPYCLHCSSNVCKPLK